MSQAVNRIALCPPGWPCSSRFPACVLFVLALALCLQAVHLTSLSGSGPKTYFIHWNMSNSVFRIDNTDHIFDINKGNSRFEYDQMNIICPVYAHGTRDEDTEKYIIYNVSKEEYDTCRITNPNPRIIAVCDKPFKLMYFTITFRPFTPQPGGLEFLPGHDYYFISTSSRDDLHRRIGGRCTTHNMKVVFKVWYPHDMDQPTTSKPGPITTEPWPKWPPQDTASPVPPIREGPPAGPSTALVETASVSTTQKPTKKVKPYNKHPNDIEKSSLTRGGASAASVSSCVVSAALLLWFAMR